MATEQFEKDEMEVVLKKQKEKAKELKIELEKSKAELAELRAKLAPPKQVDPEPKSSRAFTTLILPMLKRHEYRNSFLLAGMILGLIIGVYVI